MKIIGQKTALSYLSNGMISNRLSPSLLFTGPDGVGKRTVAMELAKKLACPQQSLSMDPVNIKGCDSCPSCRKIENQTHPDLLVVSAATQAQRVKGKPEAQTSVKIESIRQINKFLSLKPMESNRRVIIIENAHTLTMDAANALLKTLEEPPPTALLILLVLDDKLLPSTIRSRCALVPFRPLPAKDISEWLQTHHHIEEQRAQKVSELSGGSFSKAEATLDKEEPVSLSDVSLDEFFDSVAQPSFRKDGRKKAEKLISQLTLEAQEKLEKGDLHQKERIELLHKAKKQIERYVPPRLVLENLYLHIRS